MLDFMKTQRAKQLIEEIQDLTKQYHAEVSSVRKPWPKSIKIRIQELFSLDVPVKKTAEQINIPYATIMSWKHPSNKKSNKDFHALTVRPRPAVTVRPSDSQNASPVLTVTVRTPEGYILELPESIVVRTILENHS
jgi:cell division septal protein FtsQ